MTRQILMGYFGMENAFTEFVWFDNAVAGDYNSKESDEAEEQDAATFVTIYPDWEEMYPFDDSKSNLDTASISVTDQEEISNHYNIMKQISGIVSMVEEKIEKYATDHIVFHTKILEAANIYEQYIGWNYTSFGEYNGVSILSDDYLVTFVEKKDCTQQYEELSKLNDFCKKNGTDFLYVQTPYKISEYDDADISGKLDFSNQNANNLLARLDAAGIDYYDIRETIHDSNLYNHDLFYKTDHHWLTTTGLWASQNILAYCNEKYGWNAELSLLDADQFDETVYEDWFLGSKGKKVTLSKCQPDDFTLIYPKYETSFHYCIPDKEMDIVGDYSIVYDMSAIEECDYYNKNPYAGCNWGDRPLIQIENQLNADDHKILLIHDSFGDCVISCLALAEKNIDAIDLRHFTGSVKKYIEESKPDLVIVMYNVIGGDINYSTHKDKFDFR
jgi:hypothetical protein